MDYKPGDIVNGHVLGADKVWHAVAAVVPTGLIAPPADVAAPATYGRRYKTRYRYTAIVMVIAIVGLNIPNGQVGILAITVNALGGLIYAAIINLLVAIAKGRTP